MGDEADYLSSQGDDGAEASMREWERESKRKYRQSRRAITQLKKQIKEELTKEIGLPQPKKYVPRGKMVERICKCGCGVKFEAREADVKRGWGRFASKSCAAIFKDRINGGIYRNEYGA